MARCTMMQLCASARLIYIGEAIHARPSIINENITINQNSRSEIGTMFLTEIELAVQLSHLFCFAGCLPNHLPIQISSCRLIPMVIEMWCDSTQEIRKC